MESVTLRMGDSVGPIDLDFQIDMDEHGVVTYTIEACNLVPVEPTAYKDGEWETHLMMHQIALSRLEKAVIHDFNDSECVGANLYYVESDWFMVGVKFTKVGDRWSMRELIEKVKLHFYQNCDSYIFTEF